MSWFAPIIGAEYCAARKVGTGYSLSKSQRALIRRMANKYAKRTRKRALIIRDLAIRFGCYEGTVRRAAK